MRKFTLECYCDGKGKRAKEVHGGTVVLRKGKVGLMLLFLFGCWAFEPGWSHGGNERNIGGDRWGTREKMNLEDCAVAPKLTQLLFLAIYTAFN